MSFDVLRKYYVFPLLGLTWRGNNRDGGLKEKRHMCKLIKETLMRYNVEIYLNSILLNILKDQMNYTWRIWIICPKETRVTFLSVTWYDKVSMFYSKFLNSKMICMHYSFFELSEKTERNSLSMTQSHLLYIYKKWHDKIVSDIHKAHILVFFSSGEKSSNWGIKVT